MNFNQKINKNKGITLIALVVTIIVLLILAGISITMLTGQNGILKRAVEAKDLTSEAQLAEDIILEENEYRIDISAGNSNALNDLIQRLEKKGYEVTEDDLNRAKKTNYDAGKANPFMAYSDNTTTDGNTTNSTGNTTNNNKTNTNSTSKNNTTNSNLQENYNPNNKFLK